MSKPIDVGAAWKNTSKKGEPYLALSFKMIDINGIPLDQCWVSLVKNVRKNNEKHPDYIITAFPKDGAAPVKKQQQQEEDGFGF